MIKDTESYNTKIQFRYYLWVMINMYSPPFYMVLSSLIFCSCSTVFITLKSNPDGASVYLVPKKVWESDTAKYSNLNYIGEYLVKESVTPIYTLDIEAGEYAVIFIVEGKKKIVMAKVDETYSEDRSKIVTAEF